MTVFQKSTGRLGKFDPTASAQLIPDCQGIAQGGAGGGIVEYAPDICLLAPVRRCEAVEWRQDKDVPKTRR